MDYEKMSLIELKDYAKSIGLNIGNIGKEKLIEKIKTKKESENHVNSVLNDEDLNKKNEVEKNKEKNTEKPISVLDSISSAIDDLEDATGGEIEEIIDLPNNYIVRVRSITFGGLTYRSRATNAIFRWNQIGAEQDMTISELNEMNNYKTDFLRKPLVILMDDKAIKKFRLISVYENVAKIKNLTTIFKSDLKTIEHVIDDALRVNMRDILISKVRQLYKTRQLVDINVIRLLEKKLKFDLSEVD